MESLIQSHGSHSQRSERKMVLGMAEKDAEVSSLSGICSVVGTNEISADKK